MDTVFSFIFLMFVLFIALSILSCLLGDLNSQQLRRLIFGCNHEWYEVEKHPIGNNSKYNFKYILKCKKCGEIKSKNI